MQAGCIERSISTKGLHTVCFEGEGALWELLTGEGQIFSTARKRGGRKRVLAWLAIAGPFPHVPGPMYSRTKGKG